MSPDQRAAVKNSATLILLRHGESVWNRQNRFTGWVDVSLSQRGAAQAEQAGILLQDHHIDVVFTSALLRAQDTAYEVLKRNRHCREYVRIHESGRAWYEHFTPAPGEDRALSIYVSEQLNERYYGDLQGMNKDEAAKQFGVEQVHLWRRSYAVRPPHGESLKMTAERTLLYYHQRMVPQLRDGRTVLVCAHGNSLRAIVMQIEGLSPEQILAFELATGTPYFYYFDAALHLLGKQILDGGKAPANDTALL